MQRDEVKELNPTTLSDLDCAICREPIERVDNRKLEGSGPIELEAGVSHYPTETDCKQVFGTSTSKLGYSNPIK